MCAGGIASSLATAAALEAIELIAAGLSFNRADRAATGCFFQVRPTPNWPA